MQSLELTIDDTSPLIYYSPFRDTLSTPDLNSGWNPYYDSSGFASSSGQLGIGTSSHITSKDGAYLTLKWNGNGIKLSGNASLASYSVTLDGSDFKPDLSSSSNGTLLDIHDLQDGDHSITLTAHIVSQNQTARNSSILMFDEAIIRTTANSTSQRIIEGNDISFKGRWTFDTAASAHTSTTEGDQACTTFDGKTFILRGMTTPDSGNFSVTLDGITTTLSAQSSFTVPNTTLFLATGLNDSVKHSVAVMNDGGKLCLLEDGFRSFTVLPGRNPPPPASAHSSSNTPLTRGTIACFALAGIITAILSSAGLYYWFVWRKRKRGNDVQSIQWDYSRFMKHQSGGSATSNWRWKNRKSYEYGKGETATIESGAGVHGEGTRSSQSSLRHLKTASMDISLPVLFKHSDPEIVVSSRAESPRSKHPYAYDPCTRWDRTAESKEDGLEDVDLNSAAFTNLKNKGKARQITGSSSLAEESPVHSPRSWSPNLLQGLHLKVSKSKFRSKTPSASLSLSLNPSTSPVVDRSSRHRFSEVSSFQAASNPSPRIWHKPISTSPVSAETPLPSLPSVPRSVSVNSNATVTHRPQDSLFLDEQTPLEEIRQDDDSDGYEPLPPPPHAYRNQGGNRNPTSLSFRQIVKSLSPRISKTGDRYSDQFYESQSILRGDQLITVEAPPTLVGEGDNLPLGNTSLPEVRIEKPSEDGSPRNSRLLPILPNLKRTSPFNIKFDWQFERDSTKRKSKNSSKRISDLSPKFLNPMNPDSPRDDFVQGSSRGHFRLSPSTINHPPPPPPPKSVSYAPSQTSDVTTSFLDFTGSSDGSSSVRTNSFKVRAESQIFGEGSTYLSAKGGRMSELKSRWSDMTASSGLRRESSREGTTSSSSGDKSSRRRTYHTSSSVPVLPPQNRPRTAESNTTQISTENSLEETSSRRTSNQFHARVLLASRYPPLPEGTDEASTSSVYNPIPPDDPDLLKKS